MKTTLFIFLYFKATVGENPFTFTFLLPDKTPFCLKYFKAIMWLITGIKRGHDINSEALYRRKDFLGRF